MADRARPHRNPSGAGNGRSLPQEFGDGRGESGGAGGAEVDGFQHLRETAGAAGVLADAVAEEFVDLGAPVRRVYSNYGFGTKILSCGRYPRSFGEYAVAGTDICTLKFEYLALLYEHPFTEKRLLGFMSDWKKAFGDTTWPRA